MTNALSYSQQNTLEILVDFLNSDDFEEIEDTGSEVKIMYQKLI